MKKPRKATPEQRAAAERAMADLRPEGEGWEAFVDEHRLAFRRKLPDGSWEIVAANDHPTHL